MTLFYIFVAALFIAVAFEVGVGIQKRKHKRKGRGNEVIKDEIKQIVQENPAYKFPIQYSECLEFNTQQAKVLGLILNIRQENITGREIFDFLSLLPQTITPGAELMMEGEEEKGNSQYHLVYDSFLRPRYVRYGYEGEEDSLPYSEYGDDKWWWEEGWKQTRPKLPETTTDAVVQMIRFLIEFGFIKLPQ